MSVAAAQKYLVGAGRIAVSWRHCYGEGVVTCPARRAVDQQSAVWKNRTGPRYEGDEDTRRKPAYHNGRNGAGSWTFPTFCEALAMAWEKSPEAVAAARAYLGSSERIMNEGCLGQIPEIFDGDAPHTPRGCDAQAWGATEALRVWSQLR